MLVFHLSFPFVRLQWLNRNELFSFFFTAERLKTQHLCLTSIFGAKSINNTASKINYLNQGKSFLCTHTDN